jgi:SH3 domain protein
MKFSKSILRLSVVSVAASICLPVAAQTAYVSNQRDIDEFQITVRTGESTNHQIVRMLTSGSKVEVLARAPATGYSQIRLEDGRTGYVLSRFLSDIPSARDRLQRAEQQLATLKAQKARIDEQLDALRQNKSQSDTLNSELTTQNEELKAQLAQIRRTAADALNLDARNKTLNSRLTASEKTIDELRIENAKLRAGSTQWWFVLGAGAVVIGALLGFVLPRMRWKRKSRWGDL